MQLFLKNKKLRVAVLMGGPSAEHEVSLASGENVFNFLDPEKYVAQKFIIPKKGDWNSEELKKFDLAFNCLHGEFGEDGRIQKTLDDLGVLYTGSGAVASAIGMDKKFSRFIFESNGLNAPHTLYFKNQNDITINELKLPLVIKPKAKGSSVGVYLARDKKDLEKAIDEAFKLDREILAEEYLQGKEITCGVLESADGGEIFALPVTEILPPESSPFFDYKAKYSGATREITPADIDDFFAREAQDIAKKAHHLLECSGYSRTDMIIKDGKIYVLEINTLPGLTKESLLPKAAAVAGISFSELLDRIIELALRKSG